MTKLMSINSKLPATVGRALAEARAAEDASRERDPNEKRATTPIDVMVANMRYWSALADSIGEQLAALVVREDDPQSARAAAELAKEFVAARSRAQQCAEAAAPFFHSRRVPSGASPSLISDVEDGAERDRGESARRIEPREDLTKLSAEELARRYREAIAETRNEGDR